MNIVSSSSDTKYINVLHFGAKGDGIADDTTAITTAIARATTQKKTLYIPSGVYKVTSEILITSSALEIEGEYNSHYANSGTIIKAVGDLRSIFSLKQIGAFTLKNIVLDANRNATYCIHFQGCSFSTFTKVHCQRAKRDGIHLAAVRDGGGATINDTNTFNDCFFESNGVLKGSTSLITASVYTNKVDLGAVTATIAASSQTVTVTGVDLTTLSLLNHDTLQIDGKYFEIQSVNSATTLTIAVRKVPATTITAQPIMFHMGCGYYELSHADNNINKFNGGLIRNNANTGLSFHGLYGPSCDLVQVDGNHAYGITIGSLDGSAGVFGALLNKCYFEGNLAAQIGVFMVRGITIISPNQDGVVPLIDLGATFQNFGILIDDLSFKRIGGYTMDIVPTNYTTAERDALQLANNTFQIIFNQTINKHQAWNGSVWNDLY